MDGGADEGCGAGTCSCGVVGVPEAWTTTAPRAQLADLGAQLLELGQDFIGVLSFIVGNSPQFSQFRQELFALGLISWCQPVPQSERAIESQQAEERQHRGYDCSEVVSLHV